MNTNCLLGLNSWISRQCSRIRLSDLSTEKTKKLLELGINPDNNSWPSWDKRFEDLKKFYILKKRAPHYLKNKSLYIWMRKNRRLRKILSKEQINKLKSIPGFVFDSRSARWMRNFKKLKSYYKKFNRNPRSDNIKLRIWVSEQKRDKNRLRPKFIKLLNSIGFNWNIQSKTSWSTMFYELLRYKKKYGTTDNLSVVSHPKLFRWLHQQRTFKRAGNLKTDRIRNLTKSNITWNIREKKEILWNKNFKILGKFKKKMGHFAIPNRHKIRHWLSIVACGYKNRTLSDYHYKKLKSIRFTPSHRRNYWESKFLELKNYFEKHGNVNVSDRENHKLFSWIKGQKVYFREDILDKNDLMRLKSVGIKFKNR
jgi:hypothetical protein